ncbi:hypothetical protein, unlikely [Trypanosoma brucei brucei TREU927]|uniref:Uncharacterized protein n=1 Tax=Trypanosoma brucei brucei (strain 927/4 GUTat10.1) TaxID=185431 RepID=Q38DU5_TRYB2|nr:hypothetical protein, unlikely [Trypanosoma brucei brucei TREU927]EAN77025.1 hypothetical protein, unlikely [Trypanosoma brucei brucei TREU927]
MHVHTHTNEYKEVNSPHSFFLFVSFLSSSFVPFAHFILSFPLCTTRCPRIGGATRHSFSSFSPGAPSFFFSFIHLRIHSSARGTGTQHFERKNDEGNHFMVKQKKIRGIKEKTAITPRASLHFTSLPFLLSGRTVALSLSFIVYHYHYQHHSNHYSQFPTTHHQPPFAVTSNNKEKEKHEVKWKRGIKNRGEV